MLEETGDKSIFDSPDKPYINVDNLSDNVQDSIKEIVR